MRHFQVWWRGSELMDFDAETADSALQQAKDFYGVKRAPRDTTVCEVPSGYYQGIVKMNREAGFNASNL